MASKPTRNIKQLGTNEHSCCWHLFHSSMPIYTNRRYVDYIMRASGGLHYTNLEVNAAYGIRRDEVISRYRNTPVTTQLNAIQLISLVELEADFAFVNIEDASNCYLRIQEHFDNWVAALSNRYLIRRPPPLEDFVKFDNLARVIFTINHDIADKLYKPKQGIRSTSLNWVKYDADYVLKDRYRDRIPDIINHYDDEGVFRGHY